MLSWKQTHYLNSEKYGNDKETAISTDIRETVIDFTNPYFTDPSALLSTAPGLASQALAVLSPFQIEVR